MDELITAMGALAGAEDGSGAVEVVAVRGDVVVVRVGDVVLKAHERGTDGSALGVRLEVARGLGGVLLAPLGPPVEVLGRVVTRWPFGEAVPQSAPEEFPLADAGRLLAALHLAPVPPGTPEAGAWSRMARAVREVPAGAPGADVVRGAFGTLPDPPRGSALIHGDWHLGQLLRHGGAWRLIDLDDLGRGHPAWDLARPAALLLAGVLDGREWDRLLTAYLGAGGPAVDPADPWAALEAPARALVVQLAARALSASVRDGVPLEPAQEALVATCDRIVSAHRGPRRG
ncbi:phosphotransferase family protein [Actinosynnema pretiosum]|uniref:Aminoglycoside phosphotransferase n=1 Tax=Actinosynnema pretiosum TaxID=42197 RepID=A0A290ZEQ9_9PSEU|nr:phosphotransferase [Actinosynnema pretiosum]ATE57453.1 aminoglycoside phosphotransferase [Actinosynnema pretiosum]